MGRDPKEVSLKKYLGSTAGRLAVDNIGLKGSGVSGNSCDTRGFL